MRIVVVLPEPFGPEEAVDLRARDREVDVVDGDEVAEAAREAARLDRELAHRAVAVVAAGTSSASSGSPVGSARAASPSRSIFAT